MGQEFVKIHEGDCLEILPTLEAGSVDAIVTDPPYGLEFMGKAWDHGVPGVPFWVEALRVLKPGGHLVAFGGTRTYHRLACAVDDAGFEVRDCLMWLYGSGFPKSLDVSKAIDKRGGANIAWFGPWLRQERERRGVTQKSLAVHFPSKTGGLTGCVANWELGFNLPTVEQFNTLCAVLGLPFENIREAEREVIGSHAGDMGGLGGDRLGSVGGDITVPATDAARQWSGWGTALKPAWESIILARKPLTGTVAANVQEHGTGALNVDGCRIPAKGRPKVVAPGAGHGGRSSFDVGSGYQDGVTDVGRWPANLVLDEEAAAMLDAQSGDRKSGGGNKNTGNRSNETFGHGLGKGIGYGIGADSGGASRFFYTAKASSGERHYAGKNTHPTVKPVSLMRWLCRLVTPPGGRVLDMFMGSGSTGIGAMAEGFQFEGIEQDPEMVEIARRRIAGPLFSIAHGDKA